MARWYLIAGEASGDFRITEMARGIEALIKVYHPKMIAIEGVQHQSSPQIVILLARLQGMIMRLCDQYQIAYEIYQPTAWRSILGFTQGQTKRKELKAQAMAYVEKSYGLHVGEDTCEAICIGLAHLKNNGMLPALEDAVRQRVDHNDRDGGPN